jgi:hypothetical protein
MFASASGLRSAIGRGAATLDSGQRGTGPILAEHRVANRLRQCPGVTPLLEQKVLEVVLHGHLGKGRVVNVAERNERQLGVVPCKLVSALQAAAVGQDQVQQDDIEAARLERLFGRRIGLAVLHQQHAVGPWPAQCRSSATGPMLTA